MPEIIRAYESATKEIKTSVLNDIIREAVAMHEPPSYKGKRLKIYFVNQCDTRPPKFEFCAAEYCIRQWIPYAGLRQEPMDIM